MEVAGPLGTPLGRHLAWRRKWQPTPVFLPRKLKAAGPARTVALFYGFGNSSGSGSEAAKLPLPSVRARALVVSPALKLKGQDRDHHHLRGPDGGSGGSWRWPPPATHAAIISPPTTGANTPFISLSACDTSTRSCYSTSADKDSDSGLLQFQT